MNRNAFAFAISASVAAMFVLATDEASGQAPTGELTGTATLEGSPLPGVTVTARSPSLQGSRTTTTGANGGYDIALLPPGLYRVEFQLEGMQTIEHDAQVSIAKTIRVDAAMVPIMRETIVTRPPPYEATAPGITLDSHDIDVLPTSRAIRDLVLLSTAASANGLRNRLTVSGAPSWDSLFLINGVVVNENLTGQPTNLLIEDAVQEVTVMSGAISAEYGRFTGGVISLVTRSGGNEFSGSFRDSAGNPGWTAATAWPGDVKAASRINHVYQSTLGGYLLKDRLWFFGAGQLARVSRQRFTTLTNVVYNAGTNERRWEGKLTALLQPQHSFVISYVDVNLDETNVADTDANQILEVAALIPQRKTPAKLLAATYTGTTASNTFVEAQYSAKRYSLEGDGGRNGERIGGTFINVRGRGVLAAPTRCGVCGADQRNSASWRLKASHYRNTRWGNHTALAGVEEFDEQHVFNGNRSASNFNIQTGQVQVFGPRAYPIFDSSTVIGWTPLLQATRGTDLRTRSAWVNDRWEATRSFVFNAGVRYDANDAHDGDGNTISDDHGISVRLGATADVSADGRNRISGTYGRYGSKILDGNAIAGSAQQSGIFAVLGWYYRGPIINGSGTPIQQLVSARTALERLMAWFDSVGGVENRQDISFTTYPGYSAIFPRSLKSPSVDEITAGYSRQSGHGSIRADFIARDWRDFYAARIDMTTGQLVDPFGNRTDTAWIVNDDRETKRTYRAVQLNGAWQKASFHAGGGYTWSTLRGNDEGEELATFDPPRNKPLTFWYPEMIGYAQRRPNGYLNQDQRHRARVWATWETAIRRTRFNASVLQSFASGRPYSIVGDIDASGTKVAYKGSPVNPGYALNQLQYYQYFFSERGAFRTDDVFSTDVALQWVVPVRSVSIFVQADLLNAFNRAAVMVVDTQVATRVSQGASSALRAFNPWTEVPVEGVHYQRGANFGKSTGPSSYQTPRTYRFSMGARF